MRKSVLIIVLFWTVCALAQTPKQWRDSISVLIEQINLHPKNVDLRLKKAEANINLSQYDYAAEEYSKVLKQDERNLAALYFRAYCYTQLRQYSMARADYDAFLAIQPEHLEAHLGLARVLQLLNRRADAVDELNRCVQMFPDSADAYAARAAYETQLKQYDAALYDWEEAIRLQPQRLEFQVSRYSVLWALKRYDEARRLADTLVKQGVPLSALERLQPPARKRRR